jgi:hypothetical protein
MHDRRSAEKLLTFNKLLRLFTGQPLLVNPALHNRVIASQTSLEFRFSDKNLPENYQAILTYALELGMDREGDRPITIA